jgi:hypothetical protein
VKGGGFSFSDGYEYHQLNSIAKQSMLATHCALYKAQKSLINRDEQVFLNSFINNG